MKFENNGIRYDLQVIASWIEPGSKVLGLGCGEGDLLHLLKTNKDATCTGIERVSAVQNPTVVEADEVARRERR